MAVQRPARIFPFVPGVYQRQSLVVDPGSGVPRGRILESLFLICRRRAPPATPARPTSFAPQCTHACRTFRLRGNEGYRRAQHRTFMFAGPWHAHAQNGRQIHGNAARRYLEGWTRPPVRLYGLLTRAARGRLREKKVIRGSVMPHHATPNHFLLARPSARCAYHQAVNPHRRPRPTLAISPRSIAMHLPTISLARVPRTGKHEGAVLRTPRPLVSSEPDGFAPVRALQSE